MCCRPQGHNESDTDRATGQQKLPVNEVVDCCCFLNWESPLIGIGGFLKSKGFGA